MINITPYLNFPGNTEDAMNFYKTVFGGEFLAFKRYGEIPGGDKMPADDQKRINHISLSIGNGNTIMATDMLPSMEENLNPGNNFHICIHAETEAEVEKIFNAVSEGGKVEMPLNKTFWGSYFGMCIDKFGIQWMINYSADQNQAK
jgi:PhnB protein